VVAVHSSRGATRGLAVTAPRHYAKVGRRVEPASSDAHARQPNPGRRRRDLNRGMKETLAMNDERLIDTGARGAAESDEEHSHLLRRARRSLSHGEGGVSGPLACAVESRPERASREPQRARLLLLAKESESCSTPATPRAGRASSAPGTSGRSRVPCSLSHRCDSNANGRRSVLHLV
jgi:hypothetical protein